MSLLVPPNLMSIMAAQYTEEQIQAACTEIDNMIVSSADDFKTVCAKMKRLAALDFIIPSKCAKTVRLARLKRELLLDLWVNYTNADDDEEY